MYPSDVNCRVIIISLPGNSHSSEAFEQCCGLNSSKLNNNTNCKTVANVNVLSLIESQFASCHESGISY